MKYKFIVGFMLVLFVLSFISAFAISTKYWEGNHLKISPGESKRVELVIQNLAGEEDVNVKGVILEGESIAKFEDGVDTFAVPLGEKLSVFLIVDASRSLEVGDVDKIVASFSILSDPDSGEFGFGMSVEREIPVDIVEGEKGEFSLTFVWYLVIVILLVLILAILFLYFQKRKKKKRKKIVK